MDDGNRSEVVQSKFVAPEAYLLDENNQLNIFHWPIQERDCRTPFESANSCEFVFRFGELPLYLVKIRIDSVRFDLSDPNPIGATCEYNTRISQCSAKIKWLGFACERRSLKRKKP